MVFSWRDLGTKFGLQGTISGMRMKPSLFVLFIVPRVLQLLTSLIALQRLLLESVLTFEDQNWKVSSDSLVSGQCDRQSWASLCSQTEGHWWGWHLEVDRLSTVAFPERTLPPPERGQVPNPHWFKVSCRAFQECLSIDISCFHARQNLS